MDPDNEKEFLVKHQLAKRNRAVYKRKITVYFKNIAKIKNDDRLTKPLFNSFVGKINEALKEIDDINEQIKQFMFDYDLESYNKIMFDNELDDQTEYVCQVSLDLDAYTMPESDMAPQNDSALSDPSDKLIEAIAKLSKSEFKPPPLRCGIFEGITDDKFLFNTFLTQFYNVIGSKDNISESVKLAYLHSYLKGYPLKMIAHLSLVDANYEIAIDMLRKEYLDFPYLIDETFKKILKTSVEYDPLFENVKVFLNDLKASVFELQNNELDFTLEDSAGNLLLSHIIMEKLPILFKKELIHKVNNNYPNLNNILDNYGDVIKTLNKTYNLKRPDKIKKESNNNNANLNQNQKFNKNKFKNKTKYKLNAESSQSEHGTLQNFYVKEKPIASPVQGVQGKKFEFKPCKFCGCADHSMNLCTKYSDLNSRKLRCLELGLCIRCSSNSHNETNCVGRNNQLCYSCKHCQKNSHIAALCDNKTPIPNTVNNLCLNLSQKTDKVYILPTYTITLTRGVKTINVRCLLDTGSQRSYISKDVALRLGEIDHLGSVTYDIHTFIGNQKKEFKQSSVLIGFDSGEKIPMALLIDDDLKLKYEVTSLNEALKNIVEGGYSLADKSFDLLNDNNVMEMEALIGADVLQYFPSFLLSKCMNGKCFNIGNQVIPFGNVELFLSKQQLLTKFKKENQNESLSLNCINETMVNHILDPCKSYFSPFQNILTDSEIEHGLEKLFNLESLGIKDVDNDMSNMDKIQVKKFKENIKFKNGHYHVDLPWHEDKINMVPHNKFVALKVLDKVTDFLDKKDLNDKYDAVFKQHLEDGIIEKFEVDPKNYDQYIWIPHRPIIRTDDQVTTKIRPVFNCSLKTRKNSPSLNEAAYTGIDLMASLLKLLFLFRSNDYVMLSDIKQAFLMIKLNLIEDKNRFCFFWKENGKVVTYRYKSLVFGYTSSPFILHYVMQHHASQYPPDECTQILSNQFYVDNLIVTGNDLSNLNMLYKQSCERMAEGGFILRSWNSNNEQLREQMQTDSCLVEHNCIEEKVLGYKYNIEQDTIHVAHTEFDTQANTKRKILSETSKLFDPLGIVTPVAVNNKIMMRELWRLESSWDEEIPDNLAIQWTHLVSDLNKLHTLDFERMAVNEDDAYGLHIFCDSSQSCYGIVMYACSDTQKHLLFSKAKVAPFKKHSIPVLELLSVVLALKCIPSLLEAYKNIKFKMVNIWIDAQVVLAWLLSDDCKTKSKFVKNRIQDVKLACENIKTDFNLLTKFNYVSTIDNPADLVTRGITFKKFQKSMPFWTEGPEWLSNNAEDWPKHPLLSVSNEVKIKSLTNFAVCENEFSSDAIVNINKYSSFQSLIKIVSNIFKFFALISKQNINCDHKAKIYLIKKMQKESFQKEIEFLKTKKEPLPPLVNDLNLFMDELGMLRSRGRIAKCLYFDYDVCNPIMLGKHHHLTHLIVLDSHIKMQHMGLQTTYNYICNSGYWIPKGRQVVKRALTSCSLCKKYNTIAYAYPKVTNISKDKMNLVKPYRHVGVDYTGHLWVKNEEGMNVKMYILIFTCLNIRAIHLELVPDMTTKNFLLAFQRFCNMHTIPTHLYSDNAKTFIQGGDLLHNSLCSNEFVEELKRNNIQHMKIPLYSAWVGSAWERLIKVVKMCMYKVVGRSRVSYFELLTILSNIQNAVNSRPLTYRSSENSLEAITPNSFLKLSSNPSLFVDTSNEVWVDGDHQDSLSSTMDIQNERFEHFKRLWYEEYLLSLREQSRDLYQAEWTNKIRVDDVVLIKLPNKPRPFWMMGRVLELIIGHDNKIRSVRIKQGNGKIVHHSICNLYPFEISLTTDSNGRASPLKNQTQLKNVNGKDDIDANSGAQKTNVKESRVPVTKFGQSDFVSINSDKDSEQTPDPDRRPKRKAALKFKQFMRDNLDAL